MTEKILVGYMSLTGFTEEVAEAVGDELKGSGLEVEVRPLQRIKAADLSSCSGLVLGTTIRMGKVAKPTLAFVRRNRKVLASLPTAYFTVGLRMKDDTPEAQAETEGYLTPLKELKEPVAVGLFAGALDLNRLAGPLRFFLSRVDDEETKEALREGDYRDWEAIRGWAREVAGALTR